jgi:hypothetical protein
MRGKELVMAMSSEQSRRPWEQQRRESKVAFEAFKAYRDMGGKRSHAKVAEQLGKSTHLMSTWSRKWEWVERVERWDVYQERQWLITRERERKKMLERQARLGQAGQGVAAEWLADLRAARETLPVTEKARGYARLAEASVKIERLARGEPTERTKTEGTLTTREQPAVMSVEEIMEHLGPDARRAVMEAIELIEAKNTPGAQGPQEESGAPTDPGTPADPE